jgi:hypothetical protein
MVCALSLLYASCFAETCRWSFFSAQVEAALEDVRAELGPEEQSGFTDSFIMETLWDCYGDVGQTIESLIGMSICSSSWQIK